MIDKIDIDGIVYGIIIQSNYSKNGIEFFTPEDYSQQLAYMKRPKGYEIKPHIHIKNLKQTTSTQEVLFIKSGKIRVDFYDKDKTYLTSRILNAGDIILLSEGGHGFSIIDEAEIIEVKQGPYNPSKDKTRFDPVKEKNIKIK